MMHPQLKIKLFKYFTPEIEIDDNDLHILTIELLPNKCFNFLIWEKVVKEGIDSMVEFFTNWVTSVAPNLIDYTRRGVKDTAYYSSVISPRYKL